MIKPQVDRERFFLVGCPRSGTTLLQSFLASHPQIESFPESHFFRNLLEKRTFAQRCLGLPSAEIRKGLKDFLTEINHLEMAEYFSQPILFDFQYTQRFQRILDEITQKSNKIAWLEKTPDHLHYISHVEHIIPNAKFVHIIRRGPDVVASLYEVAQKYPETWHGPWSIDYCIDKWKAAVQASLPYSEKQNHLLISYEKFVINPEATLQRMFDFLDLQFNYRELLTRKQASEKIISEHESWKSGVGKELKLTTNQKFSQIFSTAQQEHILAGLAPLHQEDFYISL